MVVIHKITHRYRWSIDNKNRQYYSIEWWLILSIQTNKLPLLIYTYSIEIIDYRYFTHRLLSLSIVTLTVWTLAWQNGEFVQDLSENNNPKSLPNLALWRTWKLCHVLFNICWCCRRYQNTIHFVFIFHHLSRFLSIFLLNFVSFCCS